MATVAKFESLGKFFVGQGDMLIFDAPADYSSATLATLANPKSLGDIKNGSTSWTGEAVSETIVKNEQGINVFSYVQSGSLGFEATILSTSPAMIEKFLKGTSLTETFTASDTFAVGSEVVGFGTALPVIECPIAIVNDTLNRTLIFPRAKITGALEIADNATSIKITVTAQSIDTEHLKTGVIINGAVNYGA